MELFTAIKPAEAGPWVIVLLLVSAVLTAFLRDGLVSGATVRRSDARSQAEAQRLVDQWERRLTESTRREEMWRATAAASDARADLAGEQVGEMLRYLRIVEAHMIGDRHE